MRIENFLSFHMISSLSLALLMEEVLDNRFPVEKSATLL